MKFPALFDPADEGGFVITFPDWDWGVRRAGCGLAGKGYSGKSPSRKASPRAAARLNDIVRGRCGITADTALRLAGYLG